MNLKHKYPYPLEMFGLESKVRGLYITLACDFEKVMTEIIVMCEGDDPSKRDDLELKIPFEMGKKLQRCKRELIKYNPAYYNHFIPEFEAVEELVKYRNMLAHGFSQYDENKLDKDFITFSWIEKGKKKIDKIKVYPFIKKIEKYTKHIFLLYTLHAKISEERGYK